MITTNIPLTPDMTERLGALAQLYLEKVIFGAAFSTSMDQPSSVVLDDHSMLLLAHIDDLMTRRRHADPLAFSPLTREINRLRRDLIDALVHLVQFPDADLPPRTLERLMPLPMPLHQAIDTLSVVRGDTLTAMEMAVAVQMWKAYAAWQAC